MKKKTTSKFLSCFIFTLSTGILAYGGYIYNCEKQARSLQRRERITENLEKRNQKVINFSKMVENANVSSNAKDCVVIGSGPAGHAAAIYMSRALLKTVMYEGIGKFGFPPGGQLTSTSHIENYPGVDVKTLGPDLMDNMRTQSKNHGTEIITKDIIKVDFSTWPFKLWTTNMDDKEAILAKTVIIATGANANRLSVSGEDKYWQHGISACAVCDGALPFFRNKVIVVVGGGDSACEEAVYLTKFASKVILLVRRDILRASKIMAQRVKSNPKIEIRYNRAINEILGDGENINKLVLRDTVTNDKSEISVGGLFYAIGHTPNTEIFKGQLELDNHGFIVIKNRADNRATYTSVNGVFAAGDVRDHVYKQAITAAGTGCQAALDCINYFEENNL